MPRAFSSSDNSLSMPTRFVAPQNQAQSHSSQVDADDTYQYLRLHNIPSKVEQIFSSVLNDRPDDPLQYIVDHLRHKNSNANNNVVNNDTGTGTGSGSGGGTSSTTSNNSSNSNNNNNNNNNNRNNSGGGRPGSQRDHSRDVNTTTGPPLNTQRVELPCPPSSVATPPPPSRGNERTARGRNYEEAHVVSVVNSVDTPPPVQEIHTPINQPTLTISPPTESHLRLSLTSTSRTNAGALRPSLSAIMPPWTSLRSSRNGTPYTGLASFRLAGNNSNGALGGATDALHGSVGALSLDRDDSTRSDLSALSVASVDMQDFLQEFRSAKADCAGADAKLVSVEELCDILQRVNIPLPDVTIIADLFDEVKKIGERCYQRGADETFAEDNNNTNTTAAAAGGGALMMNGCDGDVGRERVHFDAFLARMALTIQGRYPNELVRGTFFAILDSASRRRCSASIAAPPPSSLAKQSSPKGAEATGAVSRSFRSAAKTNCRVAGPADLPASAVSPTPNSTLSPAGLGESALCAAPSDSPESTPLSTLLHGVPLAVCVEEGLWQGLGMPVSKAEAINAMRLLGISTDDDYELHVNDFTRLVNALMGYGVNVLTMSGRASPWTLSLGRDNFVMQHGGSYKEDSL